mgnify:FL=1
MMLVGLFALLGLVNFLLRYAFIGLLGERPLPDWLRLGLRFVPLAILTALITPDVLLPGGEWIRSPLEPRLVAAVVAIAVAARTRHTLATLASGMLTFWLVQWLHTL